jgi:hypothetical protein
LAKLIENHNNQTAKTKPAISLKILKEFSGSIHIIEDNHRSSNHATILIQKIIKNMTKYFHAYFLCQTKSQDHLPYVLRHARSHSCTKSEFLKILFFSSNDVFSFTIDLNEKIKILLPQ